MENISQQKTTDTLYSINIQNEEKLKNINKFFLNSQQTKVNESDTFYYPKTVNNITDISINKENIKKID